MKKKNLLYAGTLALGMFMSGCNDSFLDMNNYGAYDYIDTKSKNTFYFLQFVNFIAVFEFNSSHLVLLLPALFLILLLFVFFYYDSFGLQAQQPQSG